MRVQRTHPGRGRGRGQRRVHTREVKVQRAEVTLSQLSGVHSPVRKYSGIIIYDLQAHLKEVEKEL